MNTENDSIRLVERQVALLLRRVESTRKQSIQLDRSSYLLLDTLSSRGPLTITDLAELFELDISTLSRQTASLESSGWIERLPHAADGRVKVLQITASGRAQLEESRAIRYTLYSELLEGWTEEERHAFGTYLARFNQAVRERRGQLPSAQPGDPGLVSATQAS